MYDDQLQKIRKQDRCNENKRGIIKQLQQEDLKN
jgi:hypothetical protein